MYLSHFLKSNKRITIIIVVAISVIFIMFGLVTKTVFASNSKNNSHKTITSIEIEKGDTLWSIAKEYRTNDSINLKSYIKEIMNTNGLLSETIHEGEYLIIPYYVANE